MVKSYIELAYIHSNDKLYGYPLHTNGLPSHGEYKKPKLYGKSESIMNIAKSQFYQQYKDLILFNKNLIVSGICSLVLTAIITQYYYYNASTNNFEVSLVSLLVEYVIETPIFAILYYTDNKKIYVNAQTGRADWYAIKTDLKKLVAVFSLSDVIYAVAQISFEFNLLQHTTVEPYQASVYSSIIAWAIFFVIINVSIRSVRLFDRQRLRKSMEILLELKYVILTLVGFIILVNSFIFLSSIQTRVVYTNLTINVTAATALIAGMIVLIRQIRVRSQYTRAFSFLAAGLILWFTAEFLWTYYQLGQGIETPFPSLADAFWLAGYVPLACHLYYIYNTVTRKVIGGHMLAILSSIVAAMLAFLLYLTFGISGQQQGMVELVINLTYPILDAILLIPAIVVLWSFRKGEPAYTHWVMISLFIVFVTVADIGFDYALAVNEESASQQEWIWDMFYNAGYLSIAGALFWYNRYLVLIKNT